MSAERLVLVGFMGCGKSRVGEHVARDLGWDFLDMDAVIEERLGSPIREVFRLHGEAFFREQETRLAREIAGRSRLVVAAGGGAFIRPATREALQQGALTVWLRCDLETVLARVPTDGSRPLAPDRATIERLFAEREGFYRMADCLIDASKGLPEEVALEVVAALRSRSGGEVGTSGR